MTLSELEAKLALLEQQLTDANDLEAVCQLTYRYVNSIALTQWDDLMSCFAPDARMELSDAFHEDKNHPEQHRNQRAICQPDFQGTPRD